MIAILSSFILFLYFGFVGFSILLLFSSMRPLQSALIGPAFGICVVTLPTFFLNRLGLPVASFATWVAIALGAIALAIVAVKRPRLPVAAASAFLIVLTAALVLVGRPMFSFGFEWTSYANDDMANYCLSAARFLNNGYLTPPRLDDFLSGKDYSQAYWSLQLNGVRSGPDLVLAFVWAVTKVDAPRIYMSAICALQLALVSGTAGLAAGFTKENRAPIIAAAIVGVSPMASVGVLYQLFAQIGGVAILCAGVAFLCQPPPKPILRSWLATGIVAVILVAGLLVWYPESTPFLGAAVVLYLIAFGWREPKAALRLLGFYVGTAVVALAILNAYALSAFLFVLQQQFDVGFNTVGVVRFPYFLVPSGIAAFWGLIEMANLPYEPYLSIAIACGIILFAVFIFLLIPQIKRASPAALLSALMLVMAVVMEFRSADYGLFKLSMFMQPFVAAVIASAVVMPGRIGWAGKLACVALFLVVSARTQAGYVEASYGGGDQTSRSELGYASQSKAYRQFLQLFDEARAKFPSGVTSDTPNPVVAKFQALYARGEPLHFLANDFLGSLMFAREEGKLAQINERYAMSANVQATAAAVAARKDDNPYAFASLNDNAFLVPTNLAPQQNLPLLISNGQGTIFNRSGEAHPELSELRFRWAPNLRNYLIFVPSARGAYYYSGADHGVSYYQLEHDPMWPGQSFSAIGRDLLFIVRQPTLQPRLVVAVTATLAKQFDSELPRPTANGVAIPFVGRGGGRAIVPIEPAEVSHLPYVSIDFGRDGQRFAINPRSWLMSMFGRNITLDTRSIIGFGRDISLISQEQYAALQPPANVRSFPNDLANPALEYSGIYEDGWISEHSFFVLEPRSTDRSIGVKGVIPLIDDKQFSTHLTVLVDGTEVTIRELKFGNFDIRVPITGGTGRHKIELVWDKFQRLPGDDGRPTGGHMDFIGYSGDAP